MKAMPNKLKDYYRAKCECGNYHPYEPVGPTAMLLPLYSCMSCYNKVMMRELGLEEVVFTESLTNLKVFNNDSYREI